YAEFTTYNLPQPLRRPPEFRSQHEHERAQVFRGIFPNADLFGAAEAVAFREGPFACHDSGCCRVSGEIVLPEGGLTFGGNRNAVAALRRSTTKLDNNPRSPTEI